MLPLLQQIHDKQSGPRRGPKVKELEANPEEAKTSALNVMEARLAKKTWSDRARLFRRAQEYLEFNNLPLNALNLAMFVESTGVSMQSKLQYAGLIAAVAKEMKIDLAPLTAYRAGLRNRGATIPMEQATPATRERVVQVISRFPQLELPMLLTWKTASRWGDFSELTVQENIFLLTPESIGIDWHGRTKTHRGDPHRPDRYVLITGTWTNRICQLLRALSPRQKLTNVSTAQADTRLQEFGLSGHSMKHGAALVLLDGVLQEKIQATSMSILLKHKVAMLPIAPTTIRYLQNPRAVAVLFETDKATGLL